MKRYYIILLFLCSIHGVLGQNYKENKKRNLYELNSLFLVFYFHEDSDKGVYYFVFTIDDTVFEYGALIDHRVMLNDLDTSFIDYKSVLYLEDEIFNEIRGAEFCKEEFSLNNDMSCNIFQFKSEIDAYIGKIINSDQKALTVVSSNNKKIRLMEHVEASKLYRIFPHLISNH